MRLESAARFPPQSDEGVCHPSNSGALRNRALGARRPALFASPARQELPVLVGDAKVEHDRQVLTAVKGGLAEAAAGRGGVTVVAVLICRRAAPPCSCGSIFAIEVSCDRVLSWVRLGSSSVFAL